MADKLLLGVLDYAVIVLMLIVSMVIGLLMRLARGRPQTTMDFLLAGRSMTGFPVVMSMCATLASAVTVLGQPMEVYRYGAQPMMAALAMAAGLALGAYVLIPVYFQCNVRTIYEFLEMRFGKSTRHIISALFSLQMLLFMSVVLYAPVLAIGAVSHWSFELSVFAFAAVCALYCAVGGLKAVLWTDVFQTFVMLTSYVVMLVFAVVEIGSFTGIFSRASDGGRMEFFNYNMDLTTRYTIWNCFMFGICGGYNFYGTNQIEVQRLLSMKNQQVAKRTLLISIVPIVGILLLYYFLGLVLYSVFHQCDPILDSVHSGIRRYDQLVPYFIASRLGSYPGLVGLSIAGIFSGSLSTISSAINSLATVTVVDFVQPLLPPTRFTDRQMVIIAKGLTLLYGAVCIGLTFALSKSRSLVQAAQIFLGAIEGPIAAVFTAGALSRKVSERSALLGLTAGLTLSIWVGYGSLISGYISPSLPMSTTGCSPLLNNTRISAAAPVLYATPQAEPFVLYKISFTWLRLLGTATALIVTFLCALVTGWKDEIPADSKCLSPLVRQSADDADKKDGHQLLSNGVQTDGSKPSLRNAF